MTITEANKPGLQQKLQSWYDVLVPLIESEVHDKVFSQLKQITAAGKVVCPVAADVFKSFQACDRHKVKAVIILQDPYPTFRNNVMVSDGIPLSCSYTKYLQPSLYMFYQQLEKEYGFDPDMDQRANLQYLLEEEHVLMINSALTTEKDKSGSHQEIWAEWMKWFIENVINTLYSGLPIVLCGLSAQKLEKHINPLVHHIKKIEHPAVASYQNREWKADGIFSWINEIIRGNNGPEEMVMWTRKKCETTVDRQVQKQVGKELPSAQSLGLPWTE